MMAATASRTVTSSASLTDWLNSSPRRTTSALVAAIGSLSTWNGLGFALDTNWPPRLTVIGSSLAGGCSSSFGRPRCVWVQSERPRQQPLGLGGLHRHQRHPGSAGSTQIPLEPPPELPHALDAEHPVYPGQAHHLIDQPG